MALLPLTSPWIPLPLSLTSNQNHFTSPPKPPPPTLFMACIRSPSNAHQHRRRDSFHPLLLFPSFCLPGFGLKLEPSLLRLAASAILCLAVGAARASTLSLSSTPYPQPPASHTLVETDTVDGQARKQTDALESVTEDEEMRTAFERWKSKPYALTVPLRIVSLRGSVAPSWLKEFAQVQGRRLKLQSEFRARLEDVFSELSLAAKKGSVEPKSAMAADLVTIGDSWLSLAIRKGLIEPIKDAEVQDWFKELSDRWKEPTELHALPYIAHGPNKAIQQRCQP